MCLLTVRLVATATYKTLCLVKLLPKGLSRNTRNIPRIPLFEVFPVELFLINLTLVYKSRSYKMPIALVIIWIMSGLLAVCMQNGSRCEWWLGPMPVLYFVVVCIGPFILLDTVRGIKNTRGWSGVLAAPLSLRYRR